MIADYLEKRFDCESEDFEIVVTISKIIPMLLFIPAFIIDLISLIVIGLILIICQLTKELQKIALLLFKFMSKYTNKAFTRLFKLGE